MKSFELLKRGSHVFVVCYSRKLELHDFHPYIKKGLDQNELVIVFLENYSNNEIYNALNRSAKFLMDKNFKNKDSILIKPTEAWYNPNDCLNAEIFLKKWEILITTAIKSGKEGIRGRGSGRCGRRKARPRRCSGRSGLSSAPGPWPPPAACPGPASVLS